MLITDSNAQFPMKRYIQTLGAAVMMLGSMMCSSCMDDNETPDVTDYIVTSKYSVGGPTMTISEFKDAYSSLFSQTNAFNLVEEDIIIEGVVVANDEGGNLYQTIVLAQLDGTKVNPTKCIVLAVKSTYLTPYFQMGQLVRINLNGLYIGCYSKLPKIGQPYTTSSNNLRLGPMLFELCKEHIFLVGSPKDYADHITPLVLNAGDDMLTKPANQNYQNAPMLVTVEGTFTDGDDKTILAPDELKDAGMGVDRNFKIGNTTITVRTSTQNEVSFLKMPKQKVRLTGVISYYSGWQLQLRSVNDMVVIDE